MGGDVEIESELGKGSKFHFHFPALVESLGHCEESPVVGASNAGRLSTTKALAELAGLAFTPGKSKKKITLARGRGRSASPASSRRGSRRGQKTKSIGVAARGNALLVEDNKINAKVGEEYI